MTMTPFLAWSSLIILGGGLAAALAMAYWQQGAIYRLQDRCEEQWDVIVDQGKHLKKVGQQVRALTPAPSDQTTLIPVVQRPQPVPSTVTGIPSARPQVPTANGATAVGRHRPRKAQ